MTLSRIQTTFTNAAKNNRAALISYIMAYAPDYESSLATLEGLPDAGTDIIELGMPFSDPMADGPIIQNASQIALKNGAKLNLLLEMVSKFRQENVKTPIILMGYYNPIQNYGLQKFCANAANAGIDGLLIVDLPIEEEEELRKQAISSDLAWIRLIAPTTDQKRVELIANSTTGFIYYVAVAGVTGTKSATLESISKSVSLIRGHTSLPIAVGFGIRSPENVKTVASVADGVVVGSSIVKTLLESGSETTLQFVKKLASGLSK